MKALVVYAHPEQASFNAALMNTAVETLTRLGHEADCDAAESKAVAAGRFFAVACPIEMVLPTLTPLSMVQV